jgi:circadian clock protein KaiC
METCGVRKLDEWIDGVDLLGQSSGKLFSVLSTAFRDGFHDFSIQTGGIEVYPRVIPAQHVEDQAEENVASDVAQFDALLGGGVDRGSSMLIMRAAGVDKRTLATQYVVAGVGRGEKAVVFISMKRRRRTEHALKSSVPIAGLLADGTLTLAQIDTGEVSAWQFTN